MSSAAVQGATVPHRAVLLAAMKRVVQQHDDRVSVERKAKFSNDIKTPFTAMMSLENDLEKCEI